MPVESFASTLSSSHGVSDSPFIRGVGIAPDSHASVRRPINWPSRPDVFPRVSPKAQKSLYQQCQAVSVAVSRKPQESQRNQRVAAIAERHTLKDSIFEDNWHEKNDCALAGS